MHRPSIVMAVVMTVIVAIGLLITGTDGVITQEVTPTPVQRGGQREGVTARAVASGSLEVLVPGTAFLSLGRIALKPGVSLPFDRTDPRRS